jgi:thioredoxin reductase
MMAASLKSANVDVLIIGAGPAGLTAALNLARVRRSIAIFDSGVYRNARTNHIHGLPSWDHQDPKEFRAAGKAELIGGRYDTVQWPGVAVTNIYKTESGGFVTIDSTGKEWVGKKLILATGVRDIPADISGYENCWGRSIYHCLFCHGFEDSGSATAGVLAVQACATPPPALMLSVMAHTFAKSITIYTDGNEELGSMLKMMAQAKNADFITVSNKKIDKLVNKPDGGAIVEFVDGTSETHPFLVHNPTTAPNIGMVKDLGLELSEAGTELKTSQPFYETNVKGCFAIGDAGMQAKAATLALSSGAMVAPGVVMQLDGLM